MSVTLAADGHFVPPLLPCPAGLSERSHSLSATKAVEEWGGPPLLENQAKEKQKEKDTVLYKENVAQPRS